MSAKRQIASKVMKPAIIPGHLERIDFDDPKVIAAISKAADSFDERKYQHRLEQFETRCTTGLLEFVD